MWLVWYQRADGLWNAACTCNASICGVPLEKRAAAETAHFDRARLERVFRISHPGRFEGNQIPACGPKLPEPDPNNTAPLVFP